MVKTSCAELDNRQGERGVTPFRTSRYFNQNGDWYFLTRAGHAEGPYQDKHDAEDAIDMYVRLANFRAAS